MRRKSNKLRKLEINRFSIITDNLNCCILCGSNYNINLHEVFDGSFRLRSIKYGLVVPLCFNCHRLLHDGKVKDQEIYLVNLAYNKFITTYNEDFHKIFFSKLL